MDMQDVSKLPSPPHGPLHSVSDSVQVTALSSVVAALETRVVSLTEHFDTVDARLNGLVSKQATFEITLNSIVESQLVVISKITMLTKKLDFTATSF